MEGIVSPVSRDGDDLVSFHFGLLKVCFLLFFLLSILIWIYKTGCIGCYI